MSHVTLLIVAGFPFRWIPLPPPGFDLMLSVAREAWERK